MCHSDGCFHFLVGIFTLFRYNNSASLSWRTVFRETTDLSHIKLLEDLVLTIPSTSVTCETTFSQLKLLKTCRRSRLGASLMNDLMTVKLESPNIANFHPGSAIDTWLVGGKVFLET